MSIVIWSVTKFPHDGTFDQWVPLIDYLLIISWRITQCEFRIKVVFLLLPSAECWVQCGGKWYLRGREEFDKITGPLRGNAKCQWDFAFNSSAQIWGQLELTSCPSKMNHPINMESTCYIYTSFDSPLARRSYHLHSLEVFSLHQPYIFILFPSQEDAWRR